MKNIFKKITSCFKTDKKDLLINKYYSSDELIKLGYEFISGAGKLSIIKGNDKRYTVILQEDGKFKVTRRIDALGVL